MSKFILHRVERLEQEPAQERITPGLKAAACLHRITCHEREPDKFAAVGAGIAGLAPATGGLSGGDGAREPAAYLALKSASRQSGARPTQNRQK